MENSLTKKQEGVLKIISEYINKNGHSPTISEICRLLNVRSSRTVIQYLNSLQKKNFIYRSRYAKRGIVLTKKQSCDSSVGQIPVINSIDCIDQDVLPNHLHNDYVSVSKKIIADKNSNLLAIRAIGNSMAESEIFDGDLFLLEKNGEIKNGDRVLTIVDGMPTVKKIIFSENSVILNSTSEKNNLIVMHKDLKILGKVFEILKKTEGDKGKSLSLEIPVPEKIKIRILKN